MPALNANFQFIFFRQTFNEFFRLSSGRQSQRIATNWSWKHATAVHFQGGTVLTRGKAVQEPRYFCADGNRFSAKFAGNNLPMG